MEDWKTRLKHFAVMCEKMWRRYAEVEKETENSRTDRLQSKLSAECYMDIYSISALEHNSQVQLLAVSIVTPLSSIVNLFLETS